MGTTDVSIMYSYICFCNHCVNIDSYMYMSDQVNVRNNYIEISPRSIRFNVTIARKHRINGKSWKHR